PALGQRATLAAAGLARAAAATAMAAPARGGPHRRRLLPDHRPQYSAAVQVRTNAVAPDTQSGCGRCYALDNQYIRLGVGLPQLRRRLVFGRTIAGERRIVGVELDHDIALPGLALDRGEASAADEKAGVELRKGRSIGSDVARI